MIRLADVIQGRNNSFHLLRMLAASAVLLSHSYPLATGNLHDEPLRGDFGCTFGSIGVDLFFLVSGMLVTMSLVRRDSAFDFAKARILRIWPGLTTAVLLVILVLGTALTTQTLAQYFSSKETLKYFLFNLVMFKGMAYTLPGVFAHNPTPNAVNGSLWTLPSEVKCYLALLGLWILMKLGRQTAQLAKAATGLWVGIFALFAWSLTSSTLEDAPVRLWLMFVSGAMLFFHRERIVISGRWAVVAALAIALAAGHGVVFGLVYALALPYLMLCAAYLPRGAVLHYNRVGDYSYGVYIYAYPVQQTLMHYFPTLGPLALFGSALALTLALGVLSWHLVEKPAMAFARPRRRVPAVPEATTTPA